MLGFSSENDLEGESGIVARATGTACVVTPILPFSDPSLHNNDHNNLSHSTSSSVVINDNGNNGHGHGLISSGRERLERLGINGGGSSNGNNIKNHNKNHHHNHYGHHVLKMPGSPKLQPVAAPPPITQLISGSLGLGVLGMYE